MVIPVSATSYKQKKISSYNIYVGITAQQDLPFIVPEEKLQNTFVEFFNKKFVEKKKIIKEIDKFEKKRVEMIEKRFIE